MAFKIYKPKHNSAQDEDIDEADYVDDEAFIEDEDIEWLMTSGQLVQKFTWINVNVRWNMF